MKKVLIASTVISFIEWFEQENIRLLQNKLGCEVHVACNCDYVADTSVERTQEFIANARKSGVVFHNIPFARSPFNRSNIKAYKEIKSLIQAEKFNLIHCHTPLASILVRIAARNARKHGVKLICTSHGFHFFKGASWKNWVLYYPIEKICSAYTDVLVTINKEDYAFAQKHLNAVCTEYIPGVGVDVDHFKTLPDCRQEKRAELGIPQDAFVILGVGELNVNKNHRVVLEAMAELKNPNIHFVLAGKGELQDDLPALAEKMGLDKEFHLLGFRRDVPMLYKAADMMVFPSFREGLPLSVMEGMAAGLPFVASAIRGNRDLIQDNQGGFLCSPDDAHSFAKGIQQLYDSTQMRCIFAHFNQDYIEEFSTICVMAQTEEIYRRFL